MTVYERIMAPGEWDIQLSSDVPPSVRETLVPFSTIVVYPARAQTNRLSDSIILGNSIYSGVLLSPPGSDNRISGAQLAWWMGDGDNKGSIIEGAIAQTAASLSTWIGALRPAQLSAGTVTSPGGTLTYSYEWVTRRQAIDSVSAHFGVEWRVNHNRTLDAGTAATLYGSTPIAITTTRGGASNDDTLVGLGASIAAEYNYSDYASRVIVSGPGGRNGSVGTTSPYRGPDGTLATIWNVVDSSDTPPGSEGAVATQLATTWSSAGFQRDVKITTPRRDLPVVFPVGSYFYLYAPEFGLIGTTQVRYEATQTFPVTMRALGIRWPIVDSFGVYVRYWDGSAFSYTDLSDFVAYESEDAEIEIG